MKKNLLGNDITVKFDPDGEDISIDELKEQYDALEEGMTPEAMDDITRQVATELMESFYQQDDGEATEEEIQTLAAELTLLRITTYADEFMLFFQAKSLPDSEVVVQIDADYQIEDIIVE